ncbi:DUF192 domain-containing protein [Hyunsoonleella sp. 2307UL5-6]|uniref:DUF192 domain-containing protein n=1 Tax=Hyunsoonleella sp. 2307UL5-6 TaxID=3384768 RepID=UPI0039BCE39F
MKRFLSPFYISLLISVAFYSCKKETKAVSQTEVTFKKEGKLSIFNSEKDTLKIALDIEVADTDFDIQTGLMYRNTMAKKQGMLFIFEDEQQRFFYMKNTRIPLDIIYMNSDTTIVSFQKNAKPFNETSLPSEIPAKYVLEINAGLTDTWGLKVGDAVYFSKL